MSPSQQAKRNYEPSPKKTKKCRKFKKILNTKIAKVRTRAQQYLLGTACQLLIISLVVTIYRLSFGTFGAQYYDTGCQNISSHIMSSKGLNTHIMVVMHIFGTHLLFMLMGYKMTHTPTTTNKCSSWLVCDSFYVMSTTTNSLSSLFINHIF